MITSTLVQIRVGDIDNRKQSPLTVKSEKILKKHSCCLISKKMYEVRPLKNTKLGLQSDVLEMKLFEKKQKSSLGLF